MGPIKRDDEANTPIDEYQRAGLKIAWIATHADLNSVEAENIAKAKRWLRDQSIKPDLVMDPIWLSHLHKRMFGDVWKWAGSWRTAETNIGIDHWEIPQRMQTLVSDFRVQVENESETPSRRDEIAVDFHHRLVSIHPFPNGNGRHARECGNVVAQMLGQSAFTWGKESLQEQGETRAKYIAALRTADWGDLSELMVFARS